MSSAAAICQRRGTWIPPCDGRGSQPLVDGRDEDGRLVADGELVVPRGDRAVALEAVDPALDSMTLAVVNWVEMRRPPTARAELLAVTRLVGPCPGWCSGSRGGAGRCGSCGRHTPCRPAPDRVGQGLEPAKDPLPGSVPLPSAEQVVDPAPRPVLDRYVSPRNPGPDPEPYAVDQSPPRPDRRPPRLRPLRQQRLQRYPLLVREISPTHEP